MSGNYIDRDDLDLAGVANDSYEDDELDEIIDTVEELIERLTHDRFRSVTETVHVNGNGRRLLFLKDVMSERLVSITDHEVYIVDPTQSDEVFTTLTENTDFWITKDGMALELPSDELVDPRSAFSAGTWPRGVRNVKFEGVWGWTSTPKPIKRAAVLLVAQQIDPGYEGLHQVSQLSWSGDVTSSRVTTSRKILSLTGYPNIDMLLSRYVNRSRSIGAV